MSPLAPNESQQVVRRVQAISGPDWWLASRAAAADSIVKRGLPDKRDDAWWGASPKRFFDVDWSRQDAGPVEKVSAWKGLPQWVFVDGRHRPASPEALPDGVRVCTFREAFDEGLDLSALLGSTRHQDGCAIDAVSLALHEDGLWIEVEDGVQLDRPLVLIHAASANAGASGLRAIVHVGRGASVRLVEHWCGGSTGLTAGMTETILEDDARLAWVKFETHGGQARHVQTLRGSMGARSVLDVTSLGLGARFSRTEFKVRLLGAEASVHLRGLTLGSSDQVQDHYVWVDHEVPDCQSHQMFRSLATDRARGLFTGRVVVHPDAQRTHAEQQHDSLLLSEGAIANARPQLEIYADDVSCRHGATVGQMDEDALFYLRQRGMDVEDARQLLLSAFTGAVFESLPEDGVRQGLQSHAESWLSSQGLDE